MNNLLLYLAVGLVILFGAWFILSPAEITTPTEPSTVPTPDTPTTSPVDDGTSDDDAVEAFPPSVTQNVVADIVRNTPYTAAEITVDSVTEQTWPNGCLGLAQPGEMCTEALVSGYKVQAEAGEDIFIYRTDSTGLQSRQEQ